MYIYIVYTPLIYYINTELLTSIYKCLKYLNTNNIFDWNIIIIVIHKS